MPRAPTWSTAALAGDDEEDDDGRGRARRRNWDARRRWGRREWARDAAREAFARDVAGALRFARALERVRADGVERMWTTAHGDGLRMRFDGVARGRRGGGRAGGGGGAARAVVARGEVRARRVLRRAEESRGGVADRLS